jgi:hypothetical protein
MKHVVFNSRLTANIIELMKPPDLRRDAGKQSEGLLAEGLDDRQNA